MNMCSAVFQAIENPFVFSRSALEGNRLAGTTFR